MKSKQITHKIHPKDEDFGRKYEADGKGKISSRLISNYFDAVNQLIKSTDINHGKAIEIGAGPGYSTQRLYKMLPSSIRMYASEYINDLVPLAQSRNPKIMFIQESVYELSHKDKSFDIVFLLEVLEHLDKPEMALAEISRVLKDDGVLVLGVPREPLWRVLNMSRGRYLFSLGNTTGHLNHWSSKGIVKYIEAYFGKVLIKSNPLPWTLLVATKNKVNNHN